MRRDDDEFAARDLELVYIARKLSEAKDLEQAMTADGIDFLVEPDTYKGGVVFQTARIGAFFYVVPEAAEETRRWLAGRKYRPHRKREPDPSAQA
ncbi:MAG TPA: hypothetical protein DEH78_12855 [Solibacterales bacterium]|nr:hypothetical protein [Bryobacterales bacterium]